LKRCAGLTALQITEQIVPNRVINRRSRRRAKAVTDGKTIAQPLGSKNFSAAMVDLLKIGEETGQRPGLVGGTSRTLTKMN